MTEIGSRGRVSQQPVAKLGYRPELDGLRAIAVLIVFVWHSWPILLNQRLSVPPLAGFLGVDIFFVLSGFLITTLLLQEKESTGSIRLLAFYGRRALRLIPALLLMLALGWLAATLSGPWPLPYWREALLVFTYVSNWVVNELGVLTHTWSLAVEEQYYLVWALGLFACLALGVSRRTLGILAIVGALAVGLLRFVAYGAADRTIWLNAYTSYGHLDALFLGNAVALAPELWMWARKNWVGFGATAAAIAILAIPRATSGPGRFIEQPANRTGVADVYYRGLLTVFAICVAVLIARFYLDRNDFIGRWLSKQPMPTIGRISYGLYLFHVPVFTIVAAKMQSTPAAARLGIAWVATFILASASYVAVERPALKLKSRLVPKGREHIPQWEGAPLGETS